MNTDGVKRIAKKAFVFIPAIMGVFGYAHIPTNVLSKAFAVKRGLMTLENDLQSDELIATTPFAKAKLLAIRNQISDFNDLMERLERVKGLKK